MVQQRSLMPTEIRRASQHDVKIVWPDGHESVYPARELRLACPCAACVEEVTGERRVEAAHIAQDVHPLRIDLVGRYAISIQRSDGHTTGLYAFDRLRAMCPCCQLCGRR